MLSRGIWSKSSGAGLFEVLIEVPPSPECHYVTGMQKSTKSQRGRDRKSVKRDRGKPGGKEKLYKKRWTKENEIKRTAEE